MNSLTDLLHLLLCQHVHIYDMMEFSNRRLEKCYYYLENDIAGGDHMPDHLEWNKIKENFKTSLNFKSDQEALRFVKESIEIAQRLHRLTNNCPHKIAFLKTIL